MEIVVRGKNRPVPRHLTTLSREKVARLERLARDTRRVEVEFSEVRNPREPRPQECEVTVHLTRHFVKARAAAREPEAALELVLDKIEQRVARIKDKRVTRAHEPRKHAHSNGKVGPLPRSEDGPDAVPVGSTDDARDDAVDDVDGAGASIVRVKHVASKPMPPSEAVLQMELLGHAFFLFANSDSGRAAVLYRRRDGGLGLIESAP